MIEQGNSEDQWPWSEEQWLWSEPSEDDSRRICCCKYSTEEQCTNADAYWHPLLVETSNQTENVADSENGYCCKTKTSSMTSLWGCPLHSGYAISSESIFQSAPNNTKEPGRSAFDLCVDDRAALHQCFGHQDCPGTEACILGRRKDGRSNQGIIRHCVPQVEAHLSCNDMLEQLSWVLLTTSSGGGGHLAAAVGLANKVNEKMGLKIDHLARECAERPSLAKARGMLARDAVDGLLHIKGFVVEVDMMRSACTQIVGVEAGEWLAGQWNEAMAQEKFADLQTMAQQSSMFEQFIPTISPCYRGLSDLVVAATGKFDGRGLHYVIDTQPFFKTVIASVGRQHGMRVMEVYLTDMPSEKCVHFSSPLKALAESSKTWESNHIRVHTPHANIEDLKRWFGFKDKAQYVFEAGLPIDARYRDKGLALPGQQVEVVWKSQVQLQREDGAFIDEGAVYRKLGAREVVEGNATRYTFDVKPEDRVGLIMLGSEPPTDTVVRMVELMATLGRARAGAGDPEAVSMRQALTDQKVRDQEGTAWLFVACGRARTRGGPGGLYDKVMQRVLGYEFFGSTWPQAGRRLRIVPFSGQFAIKAYARSDVALVKTGGLTTAEALSLTELDRAFSDGRKRILVNSWSSSYDLGKAIHNNEPMDSDHWQAFLADSAQVGWEGGNAEYIAREIQAQMVCVKPSKSQLRAGRSSEAFADDPGWYDRCELPFVRAMDARLYAE